jgi:hypothetical protein
MVHDIGKVGIPDRILLKPGPFDADERAEMETHTVIGEHICAPLWHLRDVLPIIRWHHERQDGSGYADSLQGSAVPLLTRILQIVDMFGRADDGPALSQSDERPAGIRYATCGGGSLVAGRGDRQGHGGAHRHAAPIAGGGRYARERGGSAGVIEFLGEGYWARWT